MQPHYSFTPETAPPEGWLPLADAIAHKMHKYTDPDALWDYKDIADYLGWAEGTVRNMARRLPKPCFTGKKKRYLAADIKAWAKQHRGKSA